MSISHLLKQLRVTEAVMKEKLKIKQEEWEAYYVKHSNHSLFKAQNLQNFDILGMPLGQIAKIGFVEKTDSDINQSKLVDNNNISQNDNKDQK